MNLLDLSAASLREKPFPCFTVARVLSEELEQELLTWFESAAPWRLAVMDFYEQYEFDFKDAVIPEGLKSLFSDDSLYRLRNKMGSLLGATLKP
jgi:hypothetical protein